MTPQNDKKTITAVTELQGPLHLGQTDRSLLLLHLPPGRHEEIQNFFGLGVEFPGVILINSVK